MIALAVNAGRPGTLRLVERPVPTPGPGEVLVRTLEVGVCGTDRGIQNGHYGVAPDGTNELVIGHEALGIVERASGSLEPGTLVAATVRRPCGQCENCATGGVDSCTTGLFRERGIIALDGFAAELFTDHPENLVVIPRRLGRLGVLAEPASVAAKGMRQAMVVGGRQGWTPRRSIVLGVGAIGMLTVFMLRLAGIATWAMARRDANEEAGRLVESVGATYVSTGETSLSDLAHEIGGADVILEAAGSAELSIEAIRALAPNGVLCLRGISGHTDPIAIDPQLLNRDLVLGNKAIIGATNASPGDWARGVRDLDAMVERWPDTMEAIISRTVTADRYADALAWTAGVKATIRFADLDSAQTE